VTEPGLLASIQGTFTFIYDLNTDTITSFELDGQATDVCAVLAEPAV
jgi:hypothetical protein